MNKYTFHFKMYTNKNDIRILEILLRGPKSKATIAFAYILCRPWWSMLQICKWGTHSLHATTSLNILHDIHVHNSEFQPSPYSYTLPAKIQKPNIPPQLTRIYKTFLVCLIYSRLCSRYNSPVKYQNFQILIC